MRFFRRDRIAFEFLPRDARNIARLALLLVVVAVSSCEPIGNKPAGSISDTVAARTVIAIASRSDSAKGDSSVTQPTNQTVASVASQLLAPKATAKRLVAAGAEERLEIGTLNGRDEEIFGSIRDVEVDSFGNIFILDDQALSVRWFDPAGIFRSSAGRAGGGPGEFRAPVGLSLSMDGELNVFDIAHRRISVFRREGDRLHQVRSIDVPLRAYDFCAIGNRHYFLAPQVNGLIHEVDATGQITRAFGAVDSEVPSEYALHRRFMVEMQNRGRLLCTAKPDRIVILYEQKPLVSAYTPTGELVWQSVLRDYHARRWELAREGRALQMAPDPATGTAHTGSMLARISADSIAVTLQESSLRDPGGHYERRLLSLRDGREVGGERANGVVAIVRGNTVFEYVNHPFPKVTVVPLSHRPKVKEPK